MISATFKPSDERTTNWLRERGPRLVQALITKMNSLNIRLHAHIVTKKLSGQVLRHRTGKLAGSIRAIAAKEEGDSIIGAVEGAGGPAWYGRLHEFRTDRPYRIVPVNKKALAFEIGGRKVIVKSVLHPPIKERSFMRSSLAEMRDDMTAELNETVQKVASEE